MAQRARMSKISGAYTIASEETRLDALRRTLRQTLSHDEVREQRGLRREKRNTPSMPKLKFLEDRKLD